MRTRRCPEDPSKLENFKSTHHFLLVEEGTMPPKYKHPSSSAGAMYHVFYDTKKDAENSTSDCLWLAASFYVRHMGLRA